MKLPLRVLACLGVLVGLASPGSAPSEWTPTLADVPYGPYADPTIPDSCETLDLYAHDDAAAPQPVLVEIHGGGFSGGAKSDFSAYLADEQGVDAIQKAYAAGFAIVSLDYPLAAQVGIPDGHPNPKFPKNKFPRAAHSVQHALQFVRCKAGEWNLDPARVFVIGTSAGGNLGLWAAMAKDIAKPKSGNPVAQQSSRPDGVVFCWTPTYLDAAHLTSTPVKPGQWDYFGAKSLVAFDKLPAKKTLAASPAWRATHAKGGPAPSAALAHLNAAMPLLGVYDLPDHAVTSSDYTFPVDDPHSAAFGFLMQEAFDAYAAQTQDPAAHWSDFALQNVDIADRASAALGADAVVAWLQQHAGLPSSVGVVSSSAMPTGH